ncbi:ABC transporter substrate-binding protein [Allostella vacuolata]|nr:ABC transporter substrate-binding protein [Stella vacuolata]
MDALTRRTFAKGALLGAAASLLPAAARAKLPDTTLRLVCPWSPGGVSDSYLRGFAAIAEKHLERRIVVENRPGSGGTVGLAFGARQRPDGSVFVGVTDAAFQYTLTQQVPFNTLTDFTFLGGTSSLTNGYVVKQDSPFRDLRDAVKAAKERPGKVRIAAGGSPASPPLVFIALESATDAKFLLLSFAGGSEYVNAVLSGEADIVGDALGPSAGMIDAGTMRLLAVASEERMERWPDVPTARELGFDILVNFTIGFLAPKGIPQDVAAIYDAAIQKVVADPEHDVLLRRLTLSKWARPGAAYEAYIRKLYDIMPERLRKLGVLKS